MSYTPMSDLGQQGLFDITRTLLQQPDLQSLSEALSQLVKRSALADSAAIVLWQAQTQRASWYATRDNGKPVIYEDETVLAHGPIRRILSRPDALHCNYHEFSETWPQLAAGGLYPPFGHYCLLPLAADGRIFGVCKPSPRLSAWWRSKFSAGSRTTSITISCAANATTFVFWSPSLTPYSPGSTWMSW